jgi:hypothetical protein
MDLEHRILCLAARTRPAPGELERLAELLRRDVDWERLWKQALLHDVGALITATFRDQRELVRSPADWLQRGERRLFATLIRNQSLLGELTAVVTRLRERDVEPMAVKGLVLARTAYGNLAVRSAADIDLLVRPGDLAVARDVLGGLCYGHREQLLFEEAHHPYHDPQYFRDGFCVELHRGLWDPKHFPHDDGIWERSVVADLGPIAVRTLSPEDTLLHLAIHRTRSPLRLRLLCDAAEHLRVNAGALDWTALTRGAHALGARTALHAMLVPARDLLDAPVPVDVLAELSVGPVKRRVVERTCGGRALFRPVADDDLAQQASLALRAFEQDGAGRITRTLARGVARKRAKFGYARRSA